MVEILFLPFLIFENIISSIAQGLNIAPPPQIFSQLGQRQQFLLPPPPSEFIKGVSISNIEEELVERDERGFIIRRTIKRNISED